jgi:RNA polymerase sigma-70 factor (ECF subfamily)
VPASDFELLQRWGDGDADAGDELVQRYVPVVHRFLFGKVERDLEDVAQRTFLACVEGRASFRRESSFKTFVIAVARRQLMLHFRKAFRGERAMRLESASVEELSGSMSQLAGFREELKLLQISLRRIPLDLQIALELHYWEEMPVAEIADVLGVPPGTVKSRLSRARDALRERILDADADEHLKRSTVHNLDQWARELRDELARG